MDGADPLFRSQQGCCSRCRVPAHGGLSVESGAPCFQREHPGTVTSALAMFGLTGRWSSDFRAFSRSDWDARTCFRGVLHHAAPYLRDQRQIVMSLDDTGLPKRTPDDQSRSQSRAARGCQIQCTGGCRLRAGRPTLNARPTMVRDTATAGSSSLLLLIAVMVGRRHASGPELGRRRSKGPGRTSLAPPAGNAWTG